MCGIAAALAVGGRADVARLRAWLRRRGPDLQRQQDYYACTDGVWRPREVAEHTGADHEGEGRMGGMGPPSAHCSLLGAVLQMRGDGEPTPQPFPPRDDAASNNDASATSMLPSLLWNGEVFGGALPVPPGACDTPVVWEGLCRLDAAVADGASLAPAVAAWLLASIQGEYAFALFSPRHSTVIFGRDPVGRRSLVARWSRPAAGAVGTEQLLLASVAGSSSDPLPAAGGAGASGPLFGWLCPDGQWAEVPIAGVYASTVRDTSLTMTEAAWPQPALAHPVLAGIAAERQGPAAPSAAAAVVPALAAVVPALAAVLQTVGYAHRPACDAALGPATRYLQALWAAVARRVDDATRGIPHGDSGAPLEMPVLVPFSGGIDSTVLAALCHYVLPLHVPIELANVSFTSGCCGPHRAHLTPDRLAAYAAFAEVHALPQASQRTWRFVEVNVCPARLASQRSRVMALAAPRGTVMDHDIGSALWFAAQGMGIVLAPSDVLSRAAFFADGALQDKLLRTAGAKAARGDGPEDLPGTSDGPEGPLVGVLVEEGFAEDDVPSGACAAGVETATAADNESLFVPDTLHLELPECAAAVRTPRRVLLATLGKEYGAALTPHWRALGHRRLGDYIAATARAGAIVCGNTGTSGQYVQLRRPADIQRAQALVDARDAACAVGGRPYTCAARVAVMGMGADETLGGYVRHGRLACVGGWPALAAELQRDFERLWQRNLGRDDRIVADHAREARFPFLDEDVLSTLRSIAAEDPAAVCEFAGATPPNQALPVAPSTAPVTGPGIGDKKILRTVARLLGLPQVSTLQKRAIQFGSRVADPKKMGSSHHE